MDTLLSPSLIMILTVLVVAMALLRPRVLAAEEWRAIVTPLASIIGSGFLVAGPILAYGAGTYAPLAMLALCAVAYLYGEAIRHNISVIEPIVNGDMPKSYRLIENTSDLALAFAYFVSVAYYINLFASYALRIDSIIDPALTKLIATGIILLLGGIGAARGLRAFENMEAIAVALKLALIAGLIAALAMAAFTRSAPNLPSMTDQQNIPVLLGLVVLVQGFETSRYLGADHSAKTRIRTMRIAQLLSTLIYMVFIMLMMPYFTGHLPAEGGETEIITLLEPVGLAIAPMVIFAALASQISAGIADLGGAGGLLNEASSNRLKTGSAYLLTAGAAIAITWGAGIMEIITYASKAFVIYYSLQSLLAFLSALGTGGKPALKAPLFAAAVLIGIAVLIYGAPVSV